MLIEFKVGNFRSFKEPVTLSMVPASISEHRQNIVNKTSINLLSSVVLYGANSSGKSNLLRAMNVMKQIIVEGFGKRSVSEILYDPFLLNTTNKNQPTLFEVSFWINGIRYRYGFEADQKRIHAEWLFYTEKKIEKPLFLRVRDGIEVMKSFPDGKDLEEKTRDNVLFLVVVDQFNGKRASEIMNWFTNFNVISGLIHDNYRAVTFKMLEDQKYRNALSQYFSDLDLGFSGINIEKKDFDRNDLPGDIPEDLIKQISSDFEGKKMVNLRTIHDVIDDNQDHVGKIEFDARRQESSGTNKLIDMSGPIFMTIFEGGVLVIDELDAKLHPLLTLSIIKLFQDQNINKHGAQLVFATHDTNILSISNLRRDQIYFVEKNRQGASVLYSLVEYNKEGKVRKDRSFEKDYINGRYGAIPYFGNFDNLTQLWQEK